MSSQAKTKTDRDKTIYNLHLGLVKYHLELNGFKNKNRKGFGPEVVEEFAFEVPAELPICRWCSGA